ncbi:MAG: hypothetical protein JNK72_25005 [Myxococcales bacterium]|nr:hypothetical protein [Myxococcales bacterium]
MGLALYLLSSGSSNELGLFRVPLATIARETDLSEGEAREAMGVLCRVGFCHFDEKRQAVFVREMAAWQYAEMLKPTDNRWKGVLAHLAAQSTHPHLAGWLARYRDAYALGDAVQLTARNVEDWQETGGVWPLPPHVAEARPKAPPRTRAKAPEGETPFRYEEPGEWRSLSSKLWWGETGDALLQAGGLAAIALAVYLVSGPSSQSLGLYPLDVTTVAKDTGLTVSEAERLLALVERTGFAERIEGWVWVREMAAWQYQPELKRESPAWKGVMARLDRLRSTPFLAVFLERYGAAWSLGSFPVGPRTIRALGALPTAAFLGERDAHLRAVPSPVAAPPPQASPPPAPRIAVTPEVKPSACECPSPETLAVATETPVVGAAAPTPTESAPGPSPQAQVQVEPLEVQQLFREHLTASHLGSRVWSRSRCSLGSPKLHLALRDELAAFAHDEQKVVTRARMETLCRFLADPKAHGDTKDWWEGEGKSLSLFAIASSGNGLLARLLLEAFEWRRAEAQRPAPTPDRPPPVKAEERVLSQEELTSTMREFRQSMEARRTSQAASPAAA